MNDKYEPVDDVPINRIFLDLANPRFDTRESIETEANAIRILCENEDIYPIAADIVKMGSINPLERLAIKSRSKAKGRETYFVAEGNRRICALRLLQDPELAPLNHRPKFIKLAKKARVEIENVDTILFHDGKLAQEWIIRTHQGPMKGVGRKTWNPRQKDNAVGSVGNYKQAIALLDYCEANELASIDDIRKNISLSTTQRFIEKKPFQEIIGIDFSDTDNIKRTRPKEIFHKLLKSFLGDLKKGQIDGQPMSRSNIDAIKLYADTSLENNKVKENELIDPEPINGEAKKDDNEVTEEGSATEAASIPPDPKKIPRNAKIVELLKKLPNSFKLQSLYYSITTIQHKHNTPLLCVGVWSFIETLTSMGGHTGNDFTQYFATDRLNLLGFNKKKEHPTIREILLKIQRNGNDTKHHRVKADFNGLTLVNDMQTLEPLLVKAIEEILEKDS